MKTAQEHYDSHLGPVYRWMVGDVPSALERNRVLFQRLGLRPGATGRAIDLGAGFGLQSLPLAELGFSVLALDSCASLLDELRALAGELPVRTVHDDMLRFRQHQAGDVDVIVCMGDTLTHLPSAEGVRALLADVAQALAPGATFITTFRDYSGPPPLGEARFIPVRSDAERILTCFLEYGEALVTVHDVLHERGPSGWSLRVSAYPKLRLAPAWVLAELSAAGLRAEPPSREGGLVSLVARKPLAD